MSGNIKKKSKKVTKQFKRLEKLSKKAKRQLKIFIIAVIAVIIAIACLFAFWFIAPSKPLYVYVLDKTVPATAADGHSYLDDVDNIYRKHIGFNWILNYKKVKNPETKKAYDYKHDYYGVQLDAAYNVDNETFLEDIGEIPDILYLSDTYGTEITESSGISKEDMNTIALCHSMGSVVIGEQDIITTGTQPNIASQLQTLFGFQETGWVGRYIYDLADLTDVPYWAPPMYKEKYGVEWRCSGSGILLVSSDGDIIVLEGKTDFEDDNLLKIRVSEDYKSEFGKRKLNYYSWFELIEPTGDTQVLAEYEFNLNSTGMEEFAPVSDIPVFAAAVRNVSDGAPTYYFAGDFNDYVDDMNISCFFGADLFYRALSFDRDGDVTNFYWHFFEPFVKTIINETYKNPSVIHYSDDDSALDTGLSSRINGNHMQLFIDGGWADLPIKGFNINAEMPGNSRYDYQSDFSYYKQLFDALGKMGANAVRAYDLYSPEFYRALYEHNKAKDHSTIYLYQGIVTPTDVDKNSITSQTSLDALYKNIEYTVDAIHGKADVPDVGSRKSAKYRHNVSAYTAAYFIDSDLSDAQYSNLISDNGYNYNGKYLSSSGNSAEALYASLCDHLFSYHYSKYANSIVVAAKGSVSMLSGAMWQENNAVTFNLSNITVDDEINNRFGVCYTAKYSDRIYQNYKKRFSGSGTSYDLYLNEIKRNSALPVFVDNFGASTCANVFDTESDIYGLSEDEQANQIIEMYKSINKGGFVGGLIADLNDSWSVVSDENYAATVPYSSAALWHDVTDLKQTSGVLSVDSIQPNEIGLSLTEADQRMSEMQLSVNETYLYVTLSLDTEVDFEKEEMFVGFDTYQRNDGEYYYSRNFFGNALSGMEFIIRFDGRNSASLFSTKSYNKGSGSVVSKESYTADYELVSILSYGSFSSQNTQFFITGNTVRIRIPWAMLNVGDPSQRIVISDSASSPSGINKQYRTTITNGMICSLFIGNKESKDTMYVFPSDKKSAGYRTYAWAEWEKENIKYAINEKKAVSALTGYFETY